MQIGFVHTVASLVPVFDAFAKQHLPDCPRLNFVDESLLQATIKDGHVSARTRRRLLGQIWGAVDAGAEVVLVTCSSIGAAVDDSAPFCTVPVLRIDEAMAEDAVRAADRIGVLGTLRTTLEPTAKLVENIGARLGKSVAVEMSLCEGAFDALRRGDLAEHDRRVRDALIRLAERNAVVLLAQASMSRVLTGPDAPVLGCTVLSSPEPAIKRLKALVELGPAASSSTLVSLSR